ncbi:MAG: RagB/SusD family nutrient uptake outer membrane protein [Bacteroides sp.]|nr:RagB/SusD family nutrient uptake outer membrane protein [Bacteroides sp.]
MKKHNFLAVGFLASTLMLAGCSDSFLELESPTQVTIQDYFTTNEHVYEALIAAYDPLQWPDWNKEQYNPVNIMSDIMADDVWVGGQNKTDNQFWHLMMNYEALPTNCMSGIWTVAYSGVKRANDVLTYIGWAQKDITEDNQKLYEAEARVLRCFYYTWLWKFWGNIPYYTENLQPPYIHEQSKADDVYSSIVTDLEGALDLNALPMKATSDNLGRVTKAMAYMLYAEIVMYQNDESRYSKALDYMKAIITDGGYDLAEDYAGIWLESGEWNVESIFEINYKDDNAVRSYDNPLYAGGTILPRLISPYGWPDGTNERLQGWGFCPVRQETYDRYAEGDTRRDATCFNAAATKVEYTLRYQDTGLFLDKYIARSGYNADQKADADLNFNNNLRIYRFAETLLNAAELIARGAGAGDASDYLNRVHKRSGLTNTVEPTLDNIIEERHLEFVGEGKRYWDLVRTGKAATVLVPDKYSYRTNTWSESKKYLPIPQGEIDAAQGTLTQNNY